jgi:hypothetical protein
MDVPPQPPATFRLAANALGFLAMLGLGWLAATSFLALDEALELGMGAGEEEPVLPFMAAFGAPLVALSLLCWALLLRGEPAWRRTPPWSWMQRASLVHLLGSVALGALVLVIS